VDLDALGIFGPPTPAKVLFARFRGGRPLSSPQVCRAPPQVPAPTPDPEALTLVEWGPHLVAALRAHPLWDGLYLRTPPTPVLSALVEKRRATSGESPALAGALAALRGGAGDGEPKLKAGQAWRRFLGILGDEVRGRGECAGAQLALLAMKGIRKDSRPRCSNPRCKRNQGDEDRARSQTWTIRAGTRPGLAMAKEPGEACPHCSSRLFTGDSILLSRLWTPLVVVWDGTGPSSLDVGLTVKDVGGGDVDLDLRGAIWKGETGLHFAPGARKSEGATAVLAVYAHSRGRRGTLTKPAKPSRKPAQGTEGDPAPPPRTRSAEDRGRSGPPEAIWSPPRDHRDDPATMFSAVPKSPDRAPPRARSAGAPRGVAGPTVPLCPNPGNTCHLAVAVHVLFLCRALVERLRAGDGGPTGELLRRILNDGSAGPRGMDDLRRAIQPQLASLDAVLREDLSAGATWMDARAALLEALHGEATRLSQGELLAAIASVRVPLREREVVECGACGSCTERVSELEGGVLAVPGRFLKGRDPFQAVRAALEPHLGCLEDRRCEACHKLHGTWTSKVSVEGPLPGVLVTAAQGSGFDRSGGAASLLKGGPVGLQTPVRLRPIAVVLHWAKRFHWTILHAVEQGGIPGWVHCDDGVQSRCAEPPAGGSSVAAVIWECLPDQAPRATSQPPRQPASSTPAPCHGGHEATQGEFSQETVASMGGDVGDADVRPAVSETAPADQDPGRPTAMERDLCGRVVSSLLELNRGRGPQKKFYWQNFDPRLNALFGSLCSAARARGDGWREWLVTTLRSTPGFPPRISGDTVRAKVADFENGGAYKTKPSQTPSPSVGSKRGRSPTESPPDTPTQEGGASQAAENLCRERCPKCDRRVGASGVDWTSVKYGEAQVPVVGVAKWVCVRCSVRFDERVQHFTCGECGRLCRKCIVERDGMEPRGRRVKVPAAKKGQ